MQAEQAKIIKPDWPKGGMVLLQADDAKQFVGKGTYCRKYVKKKDRAPHVEPVWFFNELVYTQLASKVGLNTPETRVLVCEAGEIYFASEYRAQRKPLEDTQELGRLFEEDPAQLTRALLLDLLLFNNDRTFGRSGDILSDGQCMYFIDHGHALWGDGFCFGDLHRIESECYSPKTTKAYVSDFLRCAEANELVWAEKNVENVEKEYDTVKRTVLRDFVETCSDIQKMREGDLIQAWEERHGVLLKPRLVRTMIDALHIWAGHLDEYIEGDRGPEIIRKCLGTQS